jgi:hypothetical protein
MEEGTAYGGKSMRGKVNIPFGPYPSSLFYDEENINANPKSYGLIPNIALYEVR